MVLETEKTPDKPLHRIAERYRPTLTFNHQRSHALPPGTYANVVVAAEANDVPFILVNTLRGATQVVGSQPRP